MGLLEEARPRPTQRGLAGGCSRGASPASPEPRSFECSVYPWGMGYETPFFGVYLAGRPGQAGCWRRLSLSSVFSTSSVQNPDSTPGSRSPTVNEASPLRAELHGAWHCSGPPSRSFSTGSLCAPPGCPPRCPHSGDAPCSISPGLQLPAPVHDPDPLGPEPLGYPPLVGFLLCAPLS